MFAGSPRMAKLFANKRWFDWSQSCSRSTLFNGWEVGPWLLFSIFWFAHAYFSGVLIVVFICRSDRELLGPNNQYLPKIVGVFAEVNFLLPLQFSFAFLNLRVFNLFFLLVAITKAETWVDLLFFVKGLVYKTSHKENVITSVACQLRT